jgi:hypothetical protein
VPDVIKMLLDQRMRFGQLRPLQTVVDVELDDRIYPELGFTLRVFDVDVRPRFLAGSAAASPPRCGPTQVWRMPAVRRPAR